MFDNLNTELSAYFKLLRFKKRESQDEVAEKLHVSRNTYSVWERRPIELSLDTLNEIAKVLGGDMIIFFESYVANYNK